RVLRAERRRRVLDLLVVTDRLAEVHRDDLERHRRRDGRGDRDRRRRRRRRLLLTGAERDRGEERECGGQRTGFHRLSFPDQAPGILSSWPGWMRSGFLILSLFASQMSFHFEASP